MSLLFPIGPPDPPPGSLAAFEHPFDLNPMLETEADGLDLFAEEASEVSSPEVWAGGCGNTLSTITCDCATTLSTIFCYGCDSGGGDGGDSDGGGDGIAGGDIGDDGGEPV